MSWDAVLIAGPTASGKSAVALELAERLGGIVINADSMQTYCELRVLTARPSAADEQRAPHRLYGHVSVLERYSAGQYEKDAAAALAEARGTHRVAIFTGGTGLYFEVLNKGLSPIPPVPAEIRAQVASKLDALGNDAFRAALIARDPSAARVKASDTQRLLRAASVLEATGQPLSFWQASSGTPVLNGLKVARFVLAPPREVLFERIDARFAKMIEKGGLEEARNVLGLDPTLPAAKALGVPQLQRHLAGELSLEAAIAEAQRATRQYRKRQMTWFRNRMWDWIWLESSNSSNFISHL